MGNTQPYIIYIVFLYMVSPTLYCSAEILKGAGYTSTKKEKKKWSRVKEHDYHVIHLELSIEIKYNHSQIHMLNLSFIFLFKNAPTPPKFK